MKKLLAALLVCLASSAFAQTGSVKTQAQLNTEIGTTGCVLPTCLWPDNTIGAITPFNARQTLLDLNATFFMGGSATYTSGGPLGINPTPATINQGLNITQTSPASGSTSSGPINYNVFNVVNTYNSTAVGAVNGASNTNISGFRIYYTTGGSNLGSSQQIALYGQLNETIASSSGSDMIATVGYAYSNVSGGGGILNGIVGEAQCDTGCVRARMAGAEFDSGYIGSGTGTYRTSIAIGNTSVSHASTIDAAIIVTNYGVSAGAFNKLFAFSTAYSGVGAGTNILSTSADMFWWEQTTTIANVFNAGNVTVSGSIIKFPNVNITGAGAASFGSGNAPSSTTLLVTQNATSVAGNLIAASVAQFVGANATNNVVTLNAFGAINAVTGSRASGTAASPTAVVSGDQTWALNGYAYDGANYDLGAQIAMFAKTVVANTSAQGEIRFLVAAPAVTVAGFIVPSGGWTIDSVDTVDPGAKGLNVGGQTYMPAMTNNGGAAQTGSVCWASGGSPAGKLTNDQSTTCLLSSARYKNVLGNLSPHEALGIVERLKAVTFTYKPSQGWTDYAEQFGFTAEQAASVDERLIARDNDGLPRGVRYMEFTAVLAAAIQGLKSDNDDIRAQLRRRVR